ncbi:hypothetical protein SK128_023192 [Halocaridina rubra]|uniref:Disease resistance R13L4/SHOC-2-like LRR domain-containing protein n=1 Tax=Halocaridina rubra TaxID=373956 RepID=A0AAN8WXX8_HALRR
MEETEADYEYVDELPEQQVSELLAEVWQQTILHWNYRRLRVLPDRVLDECSHIQQIYLKRNLLTNLPSSFGNLSQLTYCYLHGNNIECLPDSLGKLMSLQVLDIGNNKIKHLPKSLGRLPSLRSLVAVYNQITSFPKELCNLKALSVLMLSGNNLKYLPEAIGGLTGLQGLYVDHNQLRELPRSIASLPLLTRISCCCNALTHLPALNFKSKPTVFFDDNPQMNYLPFTLLKQLRNGESWDPVVLQTCGCFQEVAGASNSLLISLKRSTVNDNPRCLVLPPQIYWISSSVLHIEQPPLLELCLRSIWKEMREQTDVDIGIRKSTSATFSNLSQNSLPSTLCDILLTGPVTYCNYSHCKSPVFSYCSLSVIKVMVTSRIGTRGTVVPSILYFCSDLCRGMYVRDINVMKDDFSIWLHRCLKESYNIKVV